MQFAQNVRYEPGHPEDQQAFVDARVPLDHDGDEPAADPPEDRPAGDPDDPETPRSLMEPEFEHGNAPSRTRLRSSQDLLDDGPFALRRRVEIPPQQLDLTLGELRADQGASLTDHWRRIGTPGPGVDLAERQQDRERDEADALVAFYTDRGVGYKYRPKKGGKSSKNIRFEASDQLTQAGLTESRKAEWAKRKQFFALYPVSGSELEHLLAQGHKSIDRNRQKRAQTVRRWPSCRPAVQKSISQPRRSGGNHWCQNGLSNLRHRRVEHSPVVGFVRAPHGQVGRHHERLLPRVSVGTVDLNETTTWRSAGR